MYISSVDFLCSDPLRICIMYFVFQIPRKEVEFHLQTTMRLHLDLTCKIFKETTSKLEEKVNALQLKQEELDEERTTLKMQVQELKSANYSLDAKITAQEKDLSELKSQSFKFVWKITGWSNILEDAIEGENEEINSSPFFTGKPGYRLSICVQPDGDQTLRNRYLSVFLRVMIGNYDAILPWPFRCDVKFTLIDQQDDPDERKNVSCLYVVDPPFERPFSDFDCTMIGEDRFISHKNLKTRRYIVDDTLFLQVEVRPLTEA